MKLLVIEDDPKISENIILGLQPGKYSIESLQNGTQAQEKLKSHKYDLVILDLMLPGTDGMTILRSLRAADQKTPVIILSAKNAIEERIQGLEAGADDYLAKPFSPTELYLRVQSIFKRSQIGSEDTILKCDDLSLNLLTREVLLGGEKIELQSREFSLLSILMKDQTEVISKALLLQKIWDYQFDPQTNIVDVLVCRLRNKINPENETRFIHTIRGVGYVFRKK